MGWVWNVKCRGWVCYIGVRGVGCVGRGVWDVSGRVGEGCGVWKMWMECGLFGGIGEVFGGGFLECCEDFGVMDGGVFVGSGGGVGWWLWGVNVVIFV